METKKIVCKGSFNFQTDRHCQADLSQIEGRRLKGSAHVVHGYGQMMEVRTCPLCGQDNYILGIYPRLSEIIAGTAGEIIYRQ